MSDPLKNVETTLTQSNPGARTQKKAIDYVMIVNSEGNIIDPSEGNNKEETIVSGCSNMRIGPDGYADWPSRAAKSAMLTTTTGEIAFVVFKGQRYPIHPGAYLTLRGISNLNEITMNTPGEGGEVFVYWEN